MRNSCWLLSVMLIAACFSDPIQPSNTNDGGESTGDGDSDGDPGDGDGDPGDGDGDPGDGDGDGDGDGQCVPTPPTGWQGPVALNVGTNPDGLPCEAAWPIDEAFGGVGDPADPYTCNPCSCGDATGGMCPTATFGRFLNDQTCMNMAVGSYDSTTSCQTPPQPLQGFIKGLPLMGIPGSCPELGGEPVDPVPAFTQFAKVCALEGEASGCEGGLAVPEFEQPADWAACIWQDGELPSCPPGSDYSSGPFVIADMFEDTRDCSVCNCTTPGEVLCSPVTTLLYLDPNCAGEPSSFIPHNGTCYGPFGFESWQLQSEPMLVQEGTCTASGGVSSGSVTVAHHKTLCCL